MMPGLQKAIGAATIVIPHHLPITGAHAKLQLQPARLFAIAREHAGYMPDLAVRDIIQQNASVFVG